MCKLQSALTTGHKMNFAKHNHMDIKENIIKIVSIKHDKKYKIVYDALLAVTNDLNGEWVNF